MTPPSEKEVEEALADADACKDTDEGDCGTGAIVLAHAYRTLLTRAEAAEKALVDEAQQHAYDMDLLKQSLGKAQARGAAAESTAQALRAEVEDLLDVARHTHQARRNIEGKLLDACNQCGLDLRHKVHSPAPGQATEPKPCGCFGPCLCVSMCLECSPQRMVAKDVYDKNAEQWKRVLVPCPKCHPATGSGEKKPCLDPEKMHGAGDQFGGEDFPTGAGR